MELTASASLKVLFMLMLPLNDDCSVETVQGQRIGPTVTQDFTLAKLAILKHEGTYIC